MIVHMQLLLLGSSLRRPLLMVPLQEFSNRSHQYFQISHLISLQLMMAISQRIVIERRNETVSEIETMAVTEIAIGIPLDTPVADIPYLHPALVLVNAIVATTAPEVTTIKNTKNETAREIVTTKATAAERALIKAIPNRLAWAHWLKDFWAKNL
jgi:hypothetical protein